MRIQVMVLALAAACSVVAAEPAQPAVEDWAGPQIEFVAPGVVDEAQRAASEAARKAAIEAQQTVDATSGGNGYVAERSLSPSAELEAVTTAASEKRVLTTDDMVKVAPAQQPADGQTFMEKVGQSYAPVQKLTLKPGDNVMVPVAVGLTNRISTNFKMAAVKTHEGKSVIEVDGGVVYITIKELMPVGLFIYEDGVTDSAFAITLVPDNVPPVIVDAKVSMTEDMLVRGDQYRKELQAEEMRLEAEEVAKVQNYSPEYIKRIKEILTPVGQGRIPEGFSMSADLSAVVQSPCSVTISQRVGQRLIGSQELVDVVAVHNTTDRPYGLREEMCLGDGVIAVAIYNNAILQPGQATELYILRDKLYEQQRSNMRQRQRLVN